MSASSQATPTETLQPQPVALAGTRLRYFAGAISVLGGLLLWELVSRLLVANPLFLAAPSQIVQAIYALTLSGEMQRHMASARSSSRSAT